MKATELCEEIQLAFMNFDSAIEKILSKATEYSREQVGEITTMLPCAFWKALPHFVAGREKNPIYHNTQVLDNMIQLALDERLSYSQFKNAALLALLHDIGNAISRRQKFETNEVVAALKEDPQEGTGTALKAIAFRLEHMDHGPELARDVLEPFVADRKLGDEDVHFICRAIAVHDYPSIERILQDLEDETGNRAGYVAGDFLLAFDNSPFGKLIQWLREADRLFMLSEQGVIKDVRGKGLELTSKNLLDKLEDNAKKHRKEFTLYELVGRTEGFIEKTLYRTDTGYALSNTFLTNGRCRWGE